MASPNVSWKADGVAYLQIDSPKYGRWICRVDEDQYDIVGPHRWTVCPAKEKPVYAHTVIHKDGKRKRFTMQSFLYPDCPPGLVRDHINGDGFDNRRDNIRYVSPRENSLNRRQRKRKPGVVYIKKNDNFRAYFTVGHFATEDEAHEAWKDAYRKIHGELPECVDV